jgi:hypothetical protein
MKDDLPEFLANVAARFLNRCTLAMLPRSRRHWGQTLGCRAESDQQHPGMSLRGNWGPYSVDRFDVVYGLVPATLGTLGGIVLRRMSRSLNHGPVK